MTLATLLWMSDLALALPVTAAISFVYAGTRNEDPGEILAHGSRLFRMLLTFMGIVLVLLYALQAYVDYGS